MESMALSSVLRSKGKRVTPQRMAVLQAVRSSKEHPSAEQVYEEVRRSLPHISLATVYKALNELREAGQVRALPVAGKLRYDAERGPGHHHLVCEQCRTVVDVELGGYLIEPELDDEARAGFEILTADVTFRGLCPSCRGEWTMEPEGQKEKSNK